MSQNKFPDWDRAGLQATNNHSCGFLFCDAGHYGIAWWDQESRSVRYGDLDWPRKDGYHSSQAPTAAWITNYL